MAIELNEYFVKMLESDFIFEKLKFIEEQIGNEQYEFKNKNSKSNKESKSLVLFEKLEFLKAIFEKYEKNLLYVNNDSIQLTIFKKKELLDEIKKYMTISKYNEFKYLLEHLQIYLSINYNIYRKNYLDNFDPKNEENKKDIKNFISSTRKYLLENKETINLKLFDFNSIEEMEKISNANENYDKIIGKMKYVFFENKINYSPTQKIIFDIAKSIDNINSFSKIYEESPNVIHFHTESFGSLNFKDTQQMGYYDVSSYYKNFRDISIPENLIDETIKMSINNSLSLRDLNGRFQYYVNFYSNLLYNFSYKNLKTLDKQDTIDLYKDIQKFSVMMAYLLNSIEINNIEKFKNPLEMFINWNENSKICEKLVYNQAFSKEAVFEEKLFEKIIEDNLIFKNIDEKMIENSIYSDSNKVDNNKEILLMNSNKNKKDLKKSCPLEEIDTLIMKRLENLKEYEDLNNEYLKTKNLINIYSNFNEFVIKFDKNFINEKYHRPVLLFTKNSKEIVEYINSLSSHIGKSSFLKVLLEKTDFLPLEIINKERFLKDSSYRKEEDKNLKEKTEINNNNNNFDLDFDF